MENHEASQEKGLERTCWRIWTCIKRFGDGFKEVGLGFALDAIRK